MKSLPFLVEEKGFLKERGSAPLRAREPDFGLQGFDGGYSGPPPHMGHGDVGSSELYVIVYSLWFVYAICISFIGFVCLFKKITDYTKK